MSAYAEQPFTEFEEVRAHYCRACRQLAGPPSIPRQPRCRNLPCREDRTNPPCVPQRYFLAEILKKSALPPAALLTIIREAGIEPAWTEIALPNGESAFLALVLFPRDARTKRTNCTISFRPVHREIHVLGLQPVCLPTTACTWG